MSDDALRQADQFFAQGDYVRALDELRKVAPFDPDINQRIHSALARMKLMAAREFAVGRWSVAEGIVDAVQEHERFLAPGEKAECRQLVEEIGRCRDREKQVHGIVQAAATLAAQNQFPQSREVALLAMRNCRDPQLVARLRKLLGALPHPLGRLLFGFDSPLEIDQFVRAKSGATIEMVLDESGAPTEVLGRNFFPSNGLGGGFARICFPSKGASLMLMDPPPDWTDYKELGFCVRLASKGRGGFRVAIGDLQSSWTCDVKISDPYWNPRRFPLEQFQKQGSPDWRAVTCFSFTSLSDEPIELWLDEIRLKPKSW
jgi:hypothetical protein